MKGALGLTLLVCFVCLSAHAADLGQAQDLGAASVTNLSNSPDIVSRYADITADCAGNVHVIWVEEDGGQAQAGSIYYTMWDGAAWTVPNSILIADRILIPSVVVDPSGGSHLVYLGTSTLFYSRTGGGPPWSARSWSVPVPIGEQRGEDHLHWFDLNVDSQGHLHLLYYRWIEPEGGAYAGELDYVRSTDGGQSWSEPIRLSNPGQVVLAGGTDNWMAIDEQDILYAVWGEEQGMVNDTVPTAVMFARSRDGGVSWSEPAALSEPASVLNNLVATVSDGRGILHVLWTREVRDLVHIYSLDQGQTWSAPSVVFKADGDMTLYGGGSAAVDSQGWIHLVLPLDTQDLHYLAWTRERWSEPVNVTSDPARRSYWPRLAIAAGNRLHLVWNQGHPEIGLPDVAQRLARGEYDILHKEILLDAPSIKAASCEMAAWAVAATPQPPGGGAVEPTVAPAAAATAASPMALPVASAVPPAAAGGVAPVLLGVVPSLLLVLVLVIWRAARKGR